MSGDFPDLPPFPVDETTLLAVEHGMGGALTCDPPEGYGPPLDSPRLVGADYSLSTLLDFLSGTRDDPDGVAEVIASGHDVPESAPLAEQIAGAALTSDPRPHYTERDVIQALIAEVRRLREGAAEAWDEGWRAARQIVDMEGQPVWAHTVMPEGYEGNPYRADAPEATP